MYQYPYGNAQQLNLDWILSKLQELEAGSGGVDLEEIANVLVSASFDAAVQYRRYDYCFYNGKLYRALNDNIGAFNPADWLEITLGADIPVLTRLLNAVDASLTSLQGTVSSIKDNYFELDTADAKEIENGTDYDTLRTVGNYYCTSAANAATMTNTPSSIAGYDAAHRLEVIALTPYRYAQLVFYNSATPSIWYRYYNGSVWSKWGRVDATSKILYFPSVAVNTANNAEIARITDSKITTDSVLISCVFADNNNITTALTWQSYDGYITINGTCIASTTADIIISM